MTHTSPAINQSGFRARENSGNEATPTWIAALNTDWTQDVDTSFRVRFELTEANGANEAVSPEIWYNLSGTWAVVTSSTPIQFATLSGTADATATTQQLGGGGTFAAGEVTQDATWAAPSLNSEITELEVCLTIDSAQVVNTDTIGLRIYNGGSVLSGAYNQEPVITVNEAANTNVTTNTPDALAIAEQQSDISLDVGVTTNTPASLSITEQQSDIGFGVNVSANTDAIGITENQASITINTGVDASTVPIAISEQQAEIALDVNIAGGVDALAISEQQASISTDTGINTNSVSISITEGQSTVALDVNVGSGTDTIAITGLQSTIDTSGATNVDATTSPLLITEQQSGVSYDVEVTAGPETLTLTPQAAGVAVDTDIAASVEALTLTEQQATVEIATSGTNIAADVAAVNVATFTADIEAATTDPVIEHVSKGSIPLYKDAQGRVFETLEAFRESVRKVEAPAPQKERVKRAAKKVVRDVKAGKKPAVNDLQIVQAVLRERQEIIANLKHAVDNLEAIEVAKNKRRRAAALLLAA